MQREREWELEREMEREREYQYSKCWMNLTGPRTSHQMGKEMGYERWPAIKIRYPTMPSVRQRRGIMTESNESWALVQRRFKLAQPCQRDGGPPKVLTQRFLYQPWLAQHHLSNAYSMEFHPSNQEAPVKHQHWVTQVTMQSRNGWFVYSTPLVCGTMLSVTYISVSLHPMRYCHSSTYICCWLTSMGLHTLTGIGTD